MLNVAMICRVQADVAQVVAHLIGSEEVTGPSPVISFSGKPPGYCFDEDSMAGVFLFDESVIVQLVCSVCQFIFLNIFEKA